MDRNKNNISIVIVSRNRLKSMTNLLSLLNSSAALLKKKPIVLLGTEFGQYKKNYYYKNLIVKKKYFEKNTHPTIIKNKLYLNIDSNIKIFLDDDIIIKKDFLSNIIKFSKKNSNCYLKTIPVSFFSNNKNFYKKSDRVECIAFIEIGKKKFKTLFNLLNVAEDTELSNRINANKINIYETNSLEVIHKFAPNNRSLNRLKKYGVGNTIEILRSYGLYKNFFIFNVFLLRAVKSIFLYCDIVTMKAILNKIFIKNIFKDFKNLDKLILPPFNDYLFNKKTLFLNKVFINKIPKEKKTKKNFFLLLRTETYELFQIDLKKILNLFKLNNLIYLGNINDKLKIDKKLNFYSYNKSTSTFLNLNSLMKKSKIRQNLIFQISKNKCIFSEFFFRINNFYILKNFLKIKNIFIIKNNKIYYLTRLRYLFFTTIINFLSVPLIFLSFFIYLLLISPFKIKKENS